MDEALTNLTITHDQIVDSRLNQAHYVNYIVVILNRILKQVI